MYITGVHDVWVTNCTFTMSGAGVVLGGCQQAFVNNNAFYGNASNNSPTAYGCSGGHESDYSDNTAACLNRTNNQAVNRLFTTGSNGSSVLNVYCGDNSCSQCGPLAGETEQNSGEMILWENENVQFTGAPSAVEPTTLTYAGVNWTSQFGSTILYVDNGPGMGAWRRIVANTTNAITVDHAWDVAPTTASHTVLVQGGAHTVTYHNTVDGVPDYATRNIAGSGVQPGVSFDTVIANNIITHSRGGIAFGGNVQPTNQQDRLAAGSMCNNLVVNNVISNSLAGISCASSIWSPGSGATVFGPVLLNNVFRDNMLSMYNNSSTAMSIDQGYDSWNWPWQQHNLFEYNTCVNFAKGMQVGAQQGYTLIRQNNFSRTDSFTVNGLNFNSQSLWPYLYQNYLSPQCSITGTLPGAGQNLGTRRFDFSGTMGEASPAAQTATLWNIGTSTLNVSCSTNQSWLSASLSSTAIAALTTNNSTATVTVTVNSTGLSVGTYTGTVTVTGGSYATPETLFVTLGVMAPFVITSITRSANDINLAWSTTGGTINVVQFATGDGLGGPNAFTDLSGNLLIPGSGIATNSYTDAGGATSVLPRFYRIRMAP
jgi:hypothetical protein